MDRLRFRARVSLLAPALLAAWTACSGGGGGRDSGSSSSPEDACATNNGGCGSPTYYTCANNPGAAPTCTPRDLCATNNGGCGSPTYYTCTNNPGAAPTCAPRDLCASNNGGCGLPAYFTCTNNPGAAPTCTPIDLCATDNGGCGDPLYTQCTNYAGAPPSCSPLQATPAPWLLRARMNRARSGLAATELDGTIYAVGGVPYDDALESYDPGMNRWTLRSPLPTPRHGLAAASAGGKVYAVGGATNPGGGASVPSAAVEAYDPATGQWTARAPLQVARYGHAAVEVGGKIYAIGGYASPATTSVEVFDPAANAWTFRAPLPAARAFTSAAVAGGRIYVLGGSGTQGAPVLEYDPLADTWTPRGNAQGEGAAVLLGGLIHLLPSNNGASTYPGAWTTTKVSVYDPAADTWRSGTPRSAQRAGFAVVATGGVAYVLGGTITPLVSGSATTVPMVERYDGAARFWTAQPPSTFPPSPLRTLRQFRAAVIAGKVYAVGGTGWQLGFPSNGLNVPWLHEYDPATATWTFDPSMTTSRVGHAVAVLNGELWVLGGLPKSGSAFASVEVYDPVARSWSAGVPMTAGRSYFGAEVVNGVLYAIGGNGGPTPWVTVEAFDPVGGTWTPRAPMPVPRVIVGTAVVGGRIHVLSSATSAGGAYLQTVDVYDPALDAWTTLPAIPRGHITAAVVAAGDRILTLGGNADRAFEGQGPTCAVDDLDPVTGAYAVRAPMHVPRTSFSAVVSGGRVYVLGGEAASNWGETVEVYDPTP